MAVYFSVVLPAHNEEDNLPPLLQEIQSVLNQIGRTWEIIVVDDGSTDHTWNLLRTASVPVRGIRLKERSGQSAALDIGLRAANGEIIITLDADGQNDPKDIPSLLEALDGYDCVSGCRQNRQDSFHRKVITFMANTTRRWLLNDGIHDTGCSLKVFKAPCFRNVKLFKGMHRFLPVLIMIEGFHVTEWPVSHRPRTKGTSHYSIFNRGFSTIADLLAVWWMKRRHLNGAISEQSSSSNHL